MLEENECDTESIKKEMRKTEAKKKLAEEERLMKLYTAVDEIFNDMVGKFLTLLESWKVLEEHQDSVATLADSRRRLIKQTAREAQGRIKDL